LSDADLANDFKPLASAAKDILLNLAGGCFWQLGLSATLNHQKRYIVTTF